MGTGWVVLICPEEKGSAKWELVILGLWQVGGIYDSISTLQATDNFSTPTHKPWLCPTTHKGHFLLIPADREKKTTHKHKLVWLFCYFETGFTV